MTAGVAEVRRGTPELRDARFEVVEVGVDLEPAAGLQHRGFANRVVVAQRDERLDDARRRESVAFAHFDRRGVMREAQTDERHARSPARGRARNCDFGHASHRRTPARLPTSGFIAGVAGKASGHYAPLRAMMSEKDASAASRVRSTSRVV